MQKFVILFIAALAVVGVYGDSFSDESQEDVPEGGLQGMFDWVASIKRFFEDQVLTRAKCMAEIVKPAYDDIVTKLFELLDICEQHPALEKYASDARSINDKGSKVLKFVLNVLQGNLPSLGQVLGVACAIGQAVALIVHFGVINVPDLLELVNPAYDMELREIAQKAVDTVKALANIFQKAAPKVVKCI